MYIFKRTFRFVWVSLIDVVDLWLYFEFITQDNNTVHGKTEKLEEMLGSKATSRNIVHVWVGVDYWTKSLRNSTAFSNNYITNKYIYIETVEIKWSVTNKYIYIETVEIKWSVHQEHEEA